MLFVVVVVEVGVVDEGGQVVVCDFDFQVIVFDFDDFISYDGVFVQFVGSVGFYWVVGELFDVEGDMFFVDIYVENDGFDYVVFFVFFDDLFVWMVLVQIGKVNYVVNVVVQVDEEIEFGFVFYFVFNFGVDWELFGKGILWVLQGLFEVQGDVVFDWVNFQDYYFDFLGSGNDFVWMDVFFGLGYFGNVDQVFDVWFQFNKCIIVGDVGYLVCEFGFDWVFCFDIILWISFKLFYVEIDVMCFLVDVDDLYFDGLVDGKNF